MFLSLPGYHALALAAALLVTPQLLPGYQSEIVIYRRATTLRAPTYTGVYHVMQGTVCVYLPTEARDLGVERGGGGGWESHCACVTLCTHTTPILYINLQAVKIGSTKTYGTQNFTLYLL